MTPLTPTPPTPPALLSFTAAPSAPKSGIAPQELVGTANFGLALGDIVAGTGQAQSSDPSQYEVPGGNRREDNDTEKALDSSASAFALVPLIQGGKPFPSGGTSLPYSTLKESEGEAGLPYANAPLVTTSRGERATDGRSERSVAALEGRVQTTLAKPSMPLDRSPDTQPAQTSTDLALPLPQVGGLPAAQSDARDGSGAVPSAATGADTLILATRLGGIPPLEANPSRPVARSANDAVKGGSSQLADPPAPQPLAISAKALPEALTTALAGPRPLASVAIDGFAVRQDARPGETDPRRAATLEAPQPMSQIDGEEERASRAALRPSPDADNEAEGPKEGAVSMRSETGPTPIGPITSSNPAAPPPVLAAPVAAKPAPAKAQHPLRADLRVEARLRSSALPVQVAALPQSGDSSEADLVRAPEMPNPSLIPSRAAAQQSLQASVDTAISQPPASQVPSAQIPSSHVQGIPAPSMSQPTAPPIAFDPSGAALRASQLESTIDQLTEARGTFHAGKPELTVRHQEFGAITMKLEALGNDLRATISARDPGFVPAIHNALAERVIAASSDAANTSGQRGGEHGGSQSNSQSNSHGNNLAGSQGQGWQSEARYGSSTGSGQGTFQPYTGQTENRDEDLSSNPGGTTRFKGAQTGDGELFA